MAIEETNDISHFQVDEIHASLISHEHGLNSATSSSSDRAFETRFHLVKVEAEGDQMLEEEEESRT